MVVADFVLRTIPLLILSSLSDRILGIGETENEVVFYQGQMELCEG